MLRRIHMDLDRRILRFDRLMLKLGRMLGGEMDRFLLFLERDRMFIGGEDSDGFKVLIFVSLCFTGKMYWMFSLGVDVF